MNVSPLTTHECTFGRIDSIPRDMKSAAKDPMCGVGLGAGLVQPRPGRWRIQGFAQGIAWDDLFLI